MCCILLSNLKLAIRLLLYSSERVDQSYILANCVSCLAMVSELLDIQALRMKIMRSSFPPVACCLQLISIK